MLHTKLRGNRPTGSGDKIFQGFLPYMGVGPSWSCDQHHVIRFSFPCTRKLSLKNLVQIGAVVSEKIRFEFLLYTTLGQGQEMTLTFNTHIPSYIQLDVCSYQLSGHWLN